MKAIDIVIKTYEDNRSRLYAVSAIENGVRGSSYPVPSSACHNAYSVAKVFTVTAIGMLCDDGLLTTDTTLEEVFGDSFPDGVNNAWRKTTVHQLLSHTTGVENGIIDIDFFDPRVHGRDLLRFILSTEFKYEPGRERIYGDGVYYVLSRVVAAVAGRDMEEFLRERLFNPLDFHEAAWTKCPMGYSVGGSGLYIRSEDMVKLGLVYIDDGVYTDEDGVKKRIVSAEWVKTVLERGYELGRCSLDKEDYVKGAMYGQCLYISKGAHTSVAWNSYDEGTHGCGDSIEALIKAL